jgi:hypothetical protein
VHTAVLTFAVALASLPVVTERPEFLSAIANNPQVDLATRRDCVMRLVKQHCQKGMSLGDFARLLNNPNWLPKCAVQNWNQSFLSGLIPLDINPTSTTFSINVFPEAPGDKRLIYFRVKGTISAADCWLVLTGTEHGASASRPVLEVAIWEDSRPYTGIYLPLSSD